VIEKAQRMILIKWVRSGIGFTRHQKGMVRSLGLRRLNQIVERVDSPQVRGLVARIPHLVEIVDAGPRPPAWASVAEYLLLPKEVAPEPAAEREAGAPAQEEIAAPQPVAEAPGEASVKVTEEAPAAPQEAQPGKAAKAAKPAKRGAEKGKAAKEGKPAEKRAKSSPRSKK
jgi:large subunit ribosomal protein L30